MPVFAVLLTEESRFKLGTTLAVLHGIMSLFGPGLIAAGLYVKIVVDNRMVLLDKYKADPVSYTLISLGVIMAIFHGVAVIMCHQCAQLKTRDRFQAALLAVMVLFFVFLWVLLAGGILCFTHQEFMETAFTGGILKNMHNYSRSLETKTMLDDLQTSYGCCGSNNFTDWFNVSWIDPRYVPRNVDLLRRIVPRRIFPDHVPYSCCDSAVLGPCIHHFVTRRQFYTNYDQITLYKDGCVKALMNYFQVILVPIGRVVLCLFGVEWILLLLMKYFYTSMRNAIMWGDPSMDAPGWLCEKFCCLCCDPDQGKPYQPPAVKEKDPPPQHLSPHYPQPEYVVPPPGSNYDQEYGGYPYDTNGNEWDTTFDDEEEGIYENIEPLLGRNNVPQAEPIYDEPYLSPQRQAQIPQIRKSQHGNQAYQQNQLLSPQAAAGQSSWGQQGGSTGWESQASVGDAYGGYQSQTKLGRSPQSRKSQHGNQAYQQNQLLSPHAAAGQSSWGQQGGSTGWESQASVGDVYGGYNSQTERSKAGRVPQAGKTWDGQRDASDWKGEDGNATDYKKGKKKGPVSRLFSEKKSVRTRFRGLSKRKKSPDQESRRGYGERERGGHSREDKGSYRSRDENSGYERGRSPGRSKRSSPWKRSPRGKSKSPKSSPRRKSPKSKSPKASPRRSKSPKRSRRKSPFKFKGGKVGKRSRRRKR